MRFGTPAATARGFKKDDFEKVGLMIADILESLLLDDNERIKVSKEIRNKVIEMCNKYPIYKKAY